MSFFEELKRRNVFRVGIAYVLLGWVVLQAADFALDLIDAPNWVIQVFFIAGLIGLPFALFFAWAYELTPEGIKREEDVDRSASVAPNTGRKLDRAIIAFLAAAVVLLLADRFFIAGRDGPAEPTTARAEPAPASAAPAAPAPLDKSIAVLPFADMSQDRDQAWFADGLAEEILNALVRVPDLQVTARTSSFQYRDTTKSIPDIGAELGVAHVLEGSVRSAGDRVRVTAQLIRAADGFHVWSENYDRDMADMIAIQEDLAKSIALALETTMDPEALAAMAQVGTQSVTAYQEHLRGLNLRLRALSSPNTDGVENFRQAYVHFERARELDPGFSNAHLDAADFWKTQLTISRTDSGLTDLTPREMQAEYNERIEAASRSARSDADRLRILADQAEVELRLRESLDLYRQYLDIRPNDWNARFSAVFVARMLEEKDIAREMIEPWLERGLVDFGAATALSNIAYLVMDPSEAADFGLKALRRWPNDAGLLYQFHRTLLWANRRLEAAELAERYRTIAPEPSEILEARDACARGDRAGAEAQLAVIRPGDANYENRVWMIQSLLGNHEEAAVLLRELERQGVPYLVGGQLAYNQFDPTPFPSLMAVLAAEKIDRPPAQREPFACPPPERTSVAVLAFENMSPDPANEYFADGVAEEILNVLSGLEGLRVIARTSAFSFKGSDATVAEIADKLDVGYVLEGSVRRAGDRVRVTAQLIDTATESHLWSENFDRNLDDIFAVQDEIARAIAAELRVKLTDAESTTLVAAPTRNLEAYNQYLVGRQLWHQRSLQNLRSSASALQAAVTLDPEFAEAWAALADALVLIPEYDPARDITPIPQARDAVNRALELAPDMPEALTTRAYLRFMYDYDWTSAERDFQRAMALDPTYPTAQQWYGEYLAVRYRDPDAAIGQMLKGAELDPLAPVMWHVAGLVAQQFRRNEEALRYYERTLEINPNAPVTLQNLAQLFLERGDFERARRTMDRFWAAVGAEPPAGPTLIDALEDPTARPGYLERLLVSQDIASGPVDRAQELMLLGEPELALEDIERAFAQGSPYATHVNFNGVYDALRDDPRFQAHLAKMNLWPPAERPR